MALSLDWNERGEGPTFWHTSGGHKHNTTSETVPAGAKQSILVLLVLLFEVLILSCTLLALEEELSVFSGNIGSWGWNSPDRHYSTRSIGG